ncbi:MAG: PfkB family carbohydrate kinase, partial [Ignavibacterium sp.]|nr:PfkB family carbohydrate kinase [Ignavibacterium sp.]
STGCGDAFVAGLIYGWKVGDVFEHSLKFSTALASANSTTSEVCNIELNQFEQLIDQVRVEQIGKKIKLIDDSPTSY